MRIATVLTGAVLAGAALLGAAASAVADDPADGGGDARTGAGTGFRTATPVRMGERATADASAGDYLYWVFPADVGQRATVKATVTLPESATRQGASTWQIDVHDGLRRRQDCQYGSRTRTAEAGDRSVTLSCTLRTVRGWAEPWSNDPLPGAYYIRLTVLDLKERDLGLPVRAAVRVTSSDEGGAQAVDGALASPLVPHAGAAAAAEDEDSSAAKAPPAAVEPEGGWSSGWWSDRWLWTVAGGVLGALAAIGGYSVTRGSGRPAHLPPPSG
ncbi:hypothetical protein [Streptomyces sp. bgisy100]|uniref:hypothetical protein n=1 Tax=Streptomyces sp. bgisy100 TaxID=3413783 RepID=UPI003D70B42E